MNLKIVIFLLFPFALFASSQKTIMVDPLFSPESGGHNLLTAARLIEKYPRMNTKRGSSAFLARLLMTGLVFRFLNNVAVITQHEVFGHGWRIRSFDRNTAKVTGYEISLTGGATFFQTNSEKITSTQLLSIVTAGMEATAIMAKIQKLDWLNNNIIHPREARIYNLAQQDIFNYISSLQFLYTQAGHDVGMYIDLLNATYPSATLTQGKLQRLALFNLLDPMTFYAIWAEWRYIFTGKGFRARTFSWNKVRFLPNFRLTLTPFCPEVYFENFFRLKGNWMVVYLRYGSHGLNQTYGIGVDQIPIFQKNGHQLLLQLDLWLQPKFIKEPIDDFDAPGTSTKQFGIAAFVTYRMKTKFGYLLFKVGTKSSGFLQGELLRGSVIAKEVIAIQF